MKILCVQEMKERENSAPITPAALMLNAGTRSAIEIDEILKTRPWRRPSLPILVLAGKGNNGGDAWITASVLETLGYNVALYADAPFEQSKGTVQELKKNVNTSLYRGRLEEFPDADTFQIVVDGLFGTGFHGAPTGTYAELIKKVNTSGAFVFALDIPSGLDANTGIASSAIEANVTLSLGAPKQGYFLNQGPRHCGTIRDLPIGIHPPQEISVSAFGQQDARRLLPKRPYDCHKNSLGHLLCLAGSQQYTGAPFLCAEAALRSGAGLVTLAIPQKGCRRQGSASLILAPLEAANSSAFNEEMFPQLIPLIERATALLFGPGIGSQVPPSLLELLLDSNKPMILDAEGIRLLASSPHLLKKARGKELVLTPHLGEFRALENAFHIDYSSKYDRFSAIRELGNRLNGTLLLKGPQTLVLSRQQELRINLSGSPALATAGTGDVLSGIIGSFLAQGYGSFDAAALGAYVHGRAAELFSGAPRSLLADDLLTLLPQAFAQIAPPNA